MKATLKPRARGYTIVELMMALTVFTIGVTGIISMQKVTVVANQHAKNLAIATHIAQGWLDQLAADAVAWNHPSPNNDASDVTTDTTWLRLVATNASAWIRPTHDTVRDFGAGFDALGNVVNADGTGVAQARYCTHIRLSWLYPDTPAVVDGVQHMKGNGLIRAEVRVFWLRDGQANVETDKYTCDPTVVPATIGPKVDRYHFVYHTSAIRQSTAQ